jgi:hypothetical protein
MIHPVRDLCLALALLLSGVTALAWGYPAIFDEGVHKARHVAFAIGLIATVIGLPMTGNFAFALRIQRRLERGEGITARWTVSSALMQQYVESEARFEGLRPHWKPSQRDIENGLNVIFGPEVVLVGEQLFSMPSAGMQSVRAVRVIPGTPSVIEFQTLLYTFVTTGNSERLTTTKGLLRIPAPGWEQAEKVRRFYQDVIKGVNVIAPSRWKKRIVAGYVIAGISVLLFVLGYALAVATKWRADGALGLIPMILMITAPLTGIGGLVLAFIASRFQARQHGRR